ncbi:MAG: hypothetical protein PVG35_20690 [Desulfobacterales bacterium]|jgi:HEAT repeat protein
MPKTIFKYRIYTTLVAFSILLALFLPHVVKAQPRELERISEAKSAEELIEIYSDSDNAIARKRAIQALSLLAGQAESTESQAKSRLQGAVTPSAIAPAYELLDLGLADPDISVVKESIYQIGYLRLASYNEILVEMYHNAGSQFPGSQKEIQSRIIHALGQTGAPEAQALFRQILASGEVNYRTDKVLYAIRDMQDATYLEAVTAYAENVEDLMMAMGNTPETRPRYAMYMQSLQLARRVQKLLSEK